MKVHFGGRPIGAEDEHHFVPIVPREEPTGALLRTGASDKHEHHRLEDILSLIEKSRLDKSVQTQSMAIFNRLAQAEAEVHGSPPDQVHLHEVGALDAVVDIVGSVAGLRLLGIEKIYASPCILALDSFAVHTVAIPSPSPAFSPCAATFQACKPIFDLNS